MVYDPQQISWSEYRDDPHKGYNLSYVAIPFNVGPIEVRLAILDVDDEPEPKLEIRTFCGEVKLFWSEHNLDLFGGPEEMDNRRILEARINDMMPGIVHEAHMALEARLKETEALLKKLRETDHRMGRVELVRGMNRITVTRAVARNVMLHQATAEGQMWNQAKLIHPPYRLAQVADDRLIAYDRNNRIMARIGYDPEGVELLFDSVSPRTSLGLYVIPDGPLEEL